MASTNNSNEAIVLYDLTSRGKNSTWSPNVWKTRMMLNYKNQPYRVHWLEWNEVRPTLEPTGVTPNNDGWSSPYTCPALQFPDGIYTMDSKKIAYALEERYPSSPAFHIDTPQLATFESTVPQLMQFFVPLIIPNVPRKILTEQSVDYYKEGFKRKRGMDIDELANMSEEQKEERWQEAVPVFKKMAEIWKLDDSGPFALGKEISYVDFHMVGLLHFLRRADETFFSKVLDVDPVLGEVYGAVEKLGVFERCED